MTKVSVVIPTYNEKDNMYPLIERIDNSIKEFDHEIIVVDDNSPDGTAQKVEELSKKYPVRVVVRKNDRGLATAVLEGFRNATGDVYAVIDADLQHPPEKLRSLIWEACNGSDIAIGSRYANEKGFGGFRLHRKVMSRGANVMAKVFVPRVSKVKDVQSGFFALKKDVIQDVELKPTGYKILLEILAMGKYHTVTEVPYDFGKRKYGDSKLGAGVIIDYLLHLTTLSFREKESQRLIKFILTGVIGIGLGIGLLWFMTEAMGIFYLISGTISKEIGILVSFILNEFWVFNDRVTFAMKDSAKRLVQFNLNRILSMIIVIISMAAFTELLGLHYIISNLIGISIAFPFNYIVSNGKIWRNEKYAI